MILKLPGGADAEVPRSKVEAYLLSPSHPVGSAKARYFSSRGYRAESPEVLERSLAQLARSGTVRSTQEIEWGTKYLVTGDITAPDGEKMELATVWMVRDDAPPVLVTAYPWRPQNR
ncbi:MAG: hypothetical protein OEO79_15180 [Gemmatimonadota bacterium]|nr:hypothetical protein [Gemmatimonadota bacterium]